MSQYNVLQAIYMSFYSKKLYRDVANNWGAKTFLYLFLVVALSWIAFVWQLQTTLNLAYQKDSERIVEQIPVITIKDGKLSTPENRPYIITTPDSKERIAVIDTSGTYTTIEQANAGILITETEMITQPKPEETRNNQIPATLNAVIDPQVVNSYVQKYLGFVWIIFFIILTVCYYIYRIIQALLYAIIGKILSAIWQIPLAYDQILWITMVAVTPTIVLATILSFFNVTFPYQPLVYFLLSMAYLFYGIVSNKNQPVVVVKDDNDKKL